MKLQCLIVWLGLLLLFGCTAGDGRKRYPIEGEVQLNGEPLADGTIIFQPASGDHDADVGQIIAGKFALLATAGNKKVAVKGTKLVTDTKEPSALGGPPSPVTVSLIPAKYDRDTILRAEVKPQGPNRFVFDLTSAE
jgi:hypothetical protein